MPIYRFVCLDCGVLSETSRKIAEKDNPYKCSECGSENTKRKPAAPAVHMPVDGTFKGSGKAELDKRIGEDSEIRWDHHHKEMEKKKAVREKSGQYALGRTPDGEYVPASKDILDVRQKGYETLDYAEKKGEKIVHEE